MGLSYLILVVLMNVYCCQAHILATCYDDLLAAYSIAVSNYTQCIVNEADALRLCRSCYGEYQTADRLYGEIIMASKNNSETSCFSTALQDLELETLSEVNDFVQTSWTTSQCQYCFQGSDSDYSYKLSNNTETFFKLYSLFVDCVLNHTKVTPSPFADLTNISCNESTICHVCNSSYERLNTFYHDLEELEVLVCADMNNSMNLSRILWNDKCHKTGSDVLAMVMVAMLACVPFIFYITTAVVGKQPNLSIVRQKRWDRALVLNSPAAETESDEFQDSR